MTAQGFSVEERENSIRATVPGWRGRFFVEAILMRKWWAILLAAVLSLIAATLMLELITIGATFLEAARRSQVDQAMARQLFDLGALFILTTLIVAVGALYDWLWVTKGCEVIEFTPLSFRVGRFIALGGRGFPVSWSRRYSLDRVDDLFVSSGPAWSGRVKFFYYRRGLGKRIARFGGGIDEEEAELMMARIESRFPAYARIRIGAQTPPHPTPLRGG